MCATAGDNPLRREPKFMTAVASNQGFKCQGVKMPANVGQMFYHGEVPWHGEGSKVDSPLTVQEALEAGGLNWKVGEVGI